uniref:claudin-19-like n=1 Tax=Myxine glutinosa TaxID=7769 RepID=UPI0035900F5A
MTMVSCQLMAALLSAVGVAGIVSSAVSDEWRVTSRAASILTASWVSHGLWRDCVANAMGTVRCRRHFTVMKLELHVKVCRALMVSAVLLAVIGLLIMLPGLHCTNPRGFTCSQKVRLSATSACLLALSALTTLTAVSFYAHKITVDFYDPNLIGARYEYGPALYVGWVASGITLLTSLALCCTCKSDTLDRRSSHQSFPSIMVLSETQQRRNQRREARIKHHDRDASCGKHQSRHVYV